MALFLQTVIKLWFKFEARNTKNETNSNEKNANAPNSIDRFCHFLF